MRINKLTITNFRSIESAEIVPADFSVFVGQNNHGKTNLFEAIDWFYNETGDISQIPHLQDGKKEVSVELEFSGIQAGIETVKNPKTKESFRKFAGDRDVIRVIRRKSDGGKRALWDEPNNEWTSKNSDYRREKDELGKRFVFLIDEAELHLHPTAQRQLKDALILLATNGDQVFVNTHSSVLVADDHPRQKLFKVHKKGTTTKISPIESLDKPHVVYELLGGSPADLLFPNNFLIVEGRTEFELLRRVIARHYLDKPRLQIIFASGDAVRQQRSVDAINTIFTPLYQTPVYKERLVLICDKPNAAQQNQFAAFRRAYPNLKDNEQIFLLQTETIEESYPAPWKKTAAEVAALSLTEKAELGKVVGDAIAKDQFEQSLPTAFAAISKAWEKAHK